VQDTADYVGSGATEDGHTTPSLHTHENETMDGLSSKNQPDDEAEEEEGSDGRDAPGAKDQEDEQDNGPKPKRQREKRNDSQYL
jgi:hypothetical protein